MTTSIPIGPTVTLIANVVYALPSIPVDLTFAGGAVYTGITSTGTFTTVANGLITGAFIYSPTAGTTVKLVKRID